MSDGNPVRCGSCGVWVVDGARHTCSTEMYTCEKHPLDIPGWQGTLEELAYAVENMRYDKTVEFLDHLSTAFRSRSKSDMSAGRTKLANALYGAYTRTAVVCDYVTEAWSLCRPYMKVDR